MSAPLPPSPFFGSTRSAPIATTKSRTSVSAGPYRTLTVALPLVHPGSEAAMTSDLAHVGRNDLRVDQRIVHRPIARVERQPQFDLLALAATAASAARASSAAAALRLNSVIGSAVVAARR